MYRRGGGYGSEDLREMRKTGDQPVASWPAAEDRPIEFT